VILAAGIVSPYFRSILQNRGTLEIGRLEGLLRDANDPDVIFGYEHGRQRSYFGVWRLASAFYDAGK
jgi:hypothetical protein